MQHGTSYIQARPQACGLSWGNCACFLFKFARILAYMPIWGQHVCSSYSRIGWWEQKLRWHMQQWHTQSEMVMGTRQIASVLKGL